jgi:peptidoglycan glycosyltransferase
VESGLYNRGRLFDPRHPETQVDPGRLAFGQERLAVTPLQMAMVAAAIGNHGAEMRPQIVERIVGPDGKTVTHLKPDQLGRPIKRHTADELTHLMELVVQGGTGTAAAIPGVRVAGKTGTAEIGRGNIHTTWFAAFAPANAPRVAIAVVVENQLNGFGGTISAPIARQVMEALLKQGRTPNKG